MKQSIKADRFRENRFHGTSAEIYFLNKIGTHSEVGACMDRAALLERYRAACEQRRRWGSIVKKDVFDSIDAAIRRLKGYGGSCV